MEVPSPLCGSGIAGSRLPTSSLLFPEWSITRIGRIRPQPLGVQFEKLGWEKPTVYIEKEKRNPGQQDNAGTENSFFDNLVNGPLDTRKWQ